MLNDGNLIQLERKAEDIVANVLTYLESRTNLKSTLTQTTNHPKTQKVLEFNKTLLEPIEELPNEEDFEEWL